MLSTAAAGEAPFYIPATDAPVAPAPQPQAQRHLRRVRQPRRHRRQRGRRGRAVRLRHALPLASRALDRRRRRPLLLHSADQRRQPQLSTSTSPTPTFTPTAGSSCSRTRCTSRAPSTCARARLRERIGPDEPRRRARQLHSVLGVCQRLCRHLRGARHQARAPRPGLERGSATERRAACPTAGLDGVCARRRCTSSRRRPLLQRKRRHLRRDPGPAGEARDLRHGRQPRPRARVHRIVLPGPRRAQARAQGGDAACGIGRDLQLGRQRDPVPVDGGPLHADDGHARRPLPLRRHPLVFDHLRARRHHHRHADAVDRSGHRRRRSAAPRPPAGHHARCDQADAAPGKILHEMRGGEMAALGRCPSRQYYGTVDATPLFVMLAGAVRRAHRRLDAHPRALAGDREGAGLARRPGRHGWRRPHRVRARRARPVFPTRAGRTRTTPCSTPTAASPRARSRWSRCRATPMRRRLAASVCARALGSGGPGGNAGAPGRADCGSVFEERFWCDEHRLLCHRAGRQQGALPRAHEQSGTRVCASGIAVPSAAPSSPRRCSTAISSPAGASAPSPRARRATTRCPTTTARSGRTTTPCSRSGLARVWRQARRIGDIFEALMRATSYLDHRRIPELYCGFRRRPSRGPTLYPAACSPQAWAAAAPFSLIQSMLGLEFRPERSEVRLNNPVRAAARRVDHAAQCLARRRQRRFHRAPEPRRRGARGAAHVGQRAHLGGRGLFRAAARLSSCRPGKRGPRRPPNRAPTWPRLARRVDILRHFRGLQRCWD